MEWNDWWPGRTEEIKRNNPEINHKEAKRQAGVEWRDMKKRGQMPTAQNHARRTHIQGLPVKELTLSVPMEPKTEPAPTVGHEMFRGLIAGLRARARVVSSREALMERARLNYQRAKGETDDNDDEYDFGESLTERFVEALALEGITGDDWAELFPSELGEASGFVSSALETGASVFSVPLDVNQDGEQASVGNLIGGIASTVVNSTF